MVMVAGSNGKWKETGAIVRRKLMVSRKFYEDEPEAELKETFEPIVEPRFRGFLGWVKNKLPLSILDHALMPPHSKMAPRRVRTGQPVLKQDLPSSSCRETNVRVRICLNSLFIVCEAASARSKCAAPILNSRLLNLTEMVSRGAESAIHLDMAITTHAPHKYNPVNSLAVDVKLLESSI
jgi:hypothetical protein